MVNKRNWLGIPVMVLVFGVSVAGCKSTPPNYYTLGNVSEENCALIQVSRVFNDDSFYQFIDLVKIDGQGSVNQWQRPWSMSDGITGWTQAIVRVTPGEHTFTISFIRNTSDALSDRTNYREIPVSITYDCKAGKGYYFSFSAKYPGGFLPTTTEITIMECDIDKNGNFGGFGSLVAGANIREVAKKAEQVPFTSSDVEGFNAVVPTR